MASLLERITHHLSKLNISTLCQNGSSTTKVLISKVNGFWYNKITNTSLPYLQDRMTERFMARKNVARSDNKQRYKVACTYCILFHLFLSFSCLSVLEQKLVTELCALLPSNTILAIQSVNHQFSYCCLLVPEPANPLIVLVVSQKFQHEGCVILTLTVLVKLHRRLPTFYVLK